MALQKKCPVFVCFVGFFLLAGNLSLFAAKPLQGFSILLDPGHGGSDSGAVGPSGLKESTANLRVAKYLKLLLEADGATVSATREDDRFLSLGDRIEIAKKINPDLFVSIHHNASVKKTIENRAEIYFNSLDKGIPLKLAGNMAAGIQPREGERKTEVIPGGFFVLRNNPFPAVLTEGSYISLKPIERELKSSRALTNEAQKFRLAIRKTLTQSLLKVEVFSKKPAEVTTPFCRFLLSSSKPISGVQVGLFPSMDSSFSLARLPVMGEVYILYNTKPLSAGNYTLSGLFRGTDGSVSKMVKIPLQVKLPPKNCVVLPVAPYIPAGFEGDFPLTLVLKDGNGRINPRALPITVKWAGKSFLGITTPDGKASIALPLTGSEVGPQAVEIFGEEGIIAHCSIDVHQPNGHIILGQIFSALTRRGLEKVKIQVCESQQIQTTAGGYFFCEFPIIFRNLHLKISPPAGYVSRESWVRSEGEMVMRPIFVLDAEAPRLLGKKVGVIAPRALDSWVRPLVKGLMKCGVKVQRLAFPESSAKPEYSAVLHANSLQDIDFILSFKQEPSPILVFRHYHRGGAGKTLADSMKKLLAARSTQLDSSVQVGGDYELGHTGASCLVVGIPALLPPDSPTKLSDAFLNALENQPK